MPLTRESRVVGFDADGAVEAALQVDADHVRICAEYDIDEWELLYIADDVLAEYEAGVDDLQSRAGKLHSYIHLDFTERELFEELAPNSGAVVAYVTRMERRSLVRFLSGHEGLFLSLDRGADTTAILDAVEEIVA